MIKVYSRIPLADRLKHAAEFELAQQSTVANQLFGSAAIKNVGAKQRSVTKRTSDTLQREFEALNAMQTQPLEHTTSSDVMKVDWVAYTKILGDPEFIPVSTYISTMNRRMIQHEKGMWRGKIVCLYKVDDNTI